MPTPNQNNMGLRVVSLPNQLTRKSAYSARELELFRSAEEHLEQTRITCAQMLADAQHDIEKIKRQTEVQTQAECFEKLQIALEHLQTQQIHHEQRILDHCIAITEMAWKKLTTSMPSRSQTEALLNQVKDSIIEGVYHSIECHQIDMAHVEEYIRNLKAVYLHLDHIELAITDTIDPGRIRLKALRGGTTMIDYQFAVESIAQALKQPVEPRPVILSEQHLTQE